MKNQDIMFTRSIPKMPKARLVRSVLALGVVALIMQVSLPRAQAYDPSSLNGSYADSFSGFALVHDHHGPPKFLPINEYGPVYEAGLYTFDGAGGFTARSVLNFGAGIILNASWSATFTGTYTVNANGTGTMTWTEHRRHFVIGDGGNELRYVGTDPDGGIVVGGSMVKQ
ncbi:MAG: hypothetical protein WA496_00620 [Candidatus Udaeobacter sp.]